MEYNIRKVANGWTVGVWASSPSDHMLGGTNETHVFSNIEDLLAFITARLTAPDA